MIWTTAPRSEVDTGPRVPDAVSTVTAAVGAALLLAAVIVLSDGELPRTTLTVLIAAVGAVGGAALLDRTGGRSLGAILAIAGFVGALVAIGARLIIIVDSAGTSIEPDLWAVIASGHHRRDRHHGPARDEAHHGRGADRGHRRRGLLGGAALLHRGGAAAARSRRAATTCARSSP